MAWWGGTQPDADEPVDRLEAFRVYGAHLEAIRDRLPPELLAIGQAVPLHDARLRVLRYTPADSSLLIELQNYIDETGPRRFFLRYDGVHAFESRADPDVGLAGPGGYGDLGYDELDLTPEGLAVHRLLFSSGIELHITCRDARAWWAGEET
jgi:hypothetical protein